MARNDIDDEEIGDDKIGRRPPEVAEAAEAEAARAAAKTDGLSKDDFITWNLAQLLLLLLATTTFPGGILLTSSADVVAVEVA